MSVAYKCGNCNKQIKRSSIVCPNCGAKLDWSPKENKHHEKKIPKDIISISKTFMAVGWLTVVFWAYAIIVSLNMQGFIIFPLSVALFQGIQNIMMLFKSRDDLSDQSIPGRIISIKRIAIVNAILYVLLLLLIINIARYGLTGLFTFVLFGITPISMLIIDVILIKKTMKKR